jgi:hypothetical protein
MRARNTSNEQCLQMPRIYLHLYDICFKKPTNASSGKTLWTIFQPCMSCSSVPCGFMPTCGNWGRLHVATAYTICIVSQQDDELFHGLTVTDNSMAIEFLRDFNECAQTTIFQLLS